MNTYEHIFFVLSTAIERDEIGKAELLRFTRELGAILAEEGQDSPRSIAVNKEIHVRFRRMMHGK